MSTMIFKFVARDTEGRHRKGRIKATGEREARQFLACNGFTNIRFDRNEIATDWLGTLAKVEARASGEIRELVVFEQSSTQRAFPKWLFWFLGTCVVFATAVGVVVTFSTHRGPLLPERGGDDLVHFDISGDRTSISPIEENEITTTMPLAENASEAEPVTARAEFKLNLSERIILGKNAIDDLIDGHLRATAELLTPTDNSPVWWTGGATNASTPVTTTLANGIQQYAATTESQTDSLLETLSQLDLSAQKTFADVVIHLDVLRENTRSLAMMSQDIARMLAQDIAFDEIAGWDRRVKASFESVGQIEQRIRDAFEKILEVSFSLNVQYGLNDSLNTEPIFRWRSERIAEITLRFHTTSSEIAIDRVRESAQSRRVNLDDFEAKHGTTFSDMERELFAQHSLLSQSLQVAAMELRDCEQEIDQATRDRDDAIAQISHLSDADVIHRIRQEAYTSRQEHEARMAWWSHQLDRRITAVTAAEEHRRAEAERLRQEDIARRTVRIVCTQCLGSGQMSEGEKRVRTWEIEGMTAMGTGAGRIQTFTFKDPNGNAIHPFACRRCYGTGIESRVVDP